MGHPHGNKTIFDEHFDNFLANYLSGHDWFDIADYRKLSSRKQ